VTNKILISSDNVFDGDNFLGRREILVKDGKILEVGNGISCDNRIELGDEFVSPGFVDAHIHISGVKLSSIPESFFYETAPARMLSTIPILKKILFSGFTTVRECGDCHGVYLRDAVNAGYIEGPGIIAAGSPLTQTFGHGELSHVLPAETQSGLFGMVCDGVDDCIKASRTVLRQGSDFIKIFTTGGALSQNDSPYHEQFTLEEIRAIVREAKKAGTYVAAHAEGDIGIRNAIEGGVSFIEHGFLANEETILLIAERNIPLTPTLSVLEQINELGEKGALPKRTLEKLQPLRQHARTVVPKAQKAGIKILAGTDLIGSTGLDIDYGNNWMEMVLLNKLGGLSELEALRAATGNCSVLGKKVGRLAPGYDADIVSINGNPLEEIADVSKVAMVMKGGSIVKK
jgi:imidazolonepropionase-like amidohydrolase